MVVELPYADVGALLASGDSWARDAGGVRGQGHPLDELDLAPLVPHPSKIICVGLNYAEHIRELGREPSVVPIVFAKFDEALVGARDPIVLPAASDQVDWEGELVVVVGRAVRQAGPDEAARAIAGFAVGNDVSVRDWQRRTPQWLQGKTWEATTPVGPALVTPDEVGGVEPALRLRVEVDGEAMQGANTAEVAFGPPAIVAYVSTILTLRPGDLIFTGTPGGVGEGRHPPLSQGRPARPHVDRGPGRAGEPLCEGGDAGHPVTTQGEGR